MSPAAPDVAVLLCTFNGGRYLQEQLESLSRQTHPRWTLYPADDGSSDATLSILEQWSPAGPAVVKPVRTGPGRGHAANFLSLLCAQDVCGDYFAYADQDDVWDADKLARALQRLTAVPASLPALYCARTRSIDSHGEVCGESPLFSRPPAFANALLQNIGGGNTMLMNAAARELLLAAGPVDVVSHDWWTYLLVTGAGGEVIYDPQPCLSYRQHGDNAVGDARGLGARLRRYRGFLRGRNAGWYERNLSALRANIELLTPRNRELLQQFEKLRCSHLPGRIGALRASGVYAQTTSGQLGLYAATLLKKI
ncbi:glycosyltransferase family 2 protein [Mangrovimicrobium sediminis]|uniref:Glycosyltransferase family 2 protein n=1 Tax=Mangrovimicrobium sediminis TaxID=2562682 RepID=A0A4Z0M3R7_9GAMM|nr:glycosyltransferase family 2 protein [Haliea sp. SAOS-164]TGD74096.1 glycosyltransferase family 2 protein [Haliea sp. SAOS-164]